MRVDEDIRNKYRTSGLCMAASNRGPNFFNLTTYCTIGAKLNTGKRGGGKDSMTKLVINI
jgi:hypothetical protein